MRLLNEKTVVRLCQTHHSTREGFLQYLPPQEQCFKCQQHGANFVSKRQFFRLCGNFLYIFDPADAKVPTASSIRKPRSVLMLVGHVVEPCCNDEQIWSSNVTSFSESSSFSITWPAAAINADIDTPSCCQAVSRCHQFAASSAEEAALWIRALIASSPVCVSSRAESLVDRLNQLTRVGSSGECSEEQNLAAGLVAMPDANHSFGEQLRRNPFDEAVYKTGEEFRQQFSKLLSQRLDSVLTLMLNAEQAERDSSQKFD